MKMTINKKVFRVEYTRGTGNGGQNRNKLETCVTITHIQTGIKEKCEDQRTRGQNEKIAYNRLVEKLRIMVAEKAHNDFVIRKNKVLSGAGRIRTYNEQRNEVVDHRTKKVAPMDKVLDGRIELLK